MAIEKSIRNLIIGGAGVLVAAIIFLVLGGWCLTFVDKRHSTQLVREYMRVNNCLDTETEFACINFNPDPPAYKCDCNFDWELKEDLKGSVTLYYELEEFDQSNQTYALSRDNLQLSGNVSQSPAESCGNYSFVDNVPIFPCGEVADSMFNDTFIFEKKMSSDPLDKKSVPVEYTHLLTGDTLKYKNPPKEALQKFRGPKSWGGDRSGKLPWEKNEMPKGVENPAFQAWMDTSLKRKPVWRVNRTGEYTNGLPAGNYNMFIIIHYGVDRYNGNRTLILEGEYTETYRRSTAWGVILILLGLVALVLGAGYILLKRKRLREERRSAARVI